MLALKAAAAAVTVLVAWPTVLVVDAVYDAPALNVAVLALAALAQKLNEYWVFAVSGVL